MIDCALNDQKRHLLYVVGLGFCKSNTVVTTIPLFTGHKRAEKENLNIPDARAEYVTILLKPFSRIHIDKSFFIIETNYETQKS